MKHESHLVIAFRYAVMKLIESKNPLPNFPKGALDIPNPLELPNEVESVLGDYKQLKWGLDMNSNNEKSKTVIILPSKINQNEPKKNTLKVLNRSFGETQGKN